MKHQQHLNIQVWDMMKVGPEVPELNLLWTDWSYKNPGMLVKVDVTNMRVEPLKVA